MERERKEESGREKENKRLFVETEKADSAKKYIKCMRERKEMGMFKTRERE